MVLQPFKPLLQTLYYWMQDMESHSNTGGFLALTLLFTRFYGASFFKAYYFFKEFHYLIKDQGHKVSI